MTRDQEARMWQDAAACQTRLRGTNAQEYEIYRACADDGKGGDITNGGAPLKTFDEWMAS